MRLLYSVREAAVHALYDMGVRVQRDACVGVAIEFLNALGMCACHEENRSTGVPEVGQPCTGQTEVFENRSATLCV